MSGFEKFNVTGVTGFFLPTIHFWWQLVFKKMH
jgi:hypothetical protein